MFFRFFWQNSESDILAKNKIEGLKLVKKVLPHKVHQVGNKKKTLTQKSFFNFISEQKSVKKSKS